jgi:hypothetical protein
MSDESLACTNCGSRNVESFCAGCGQKRPAPTDYAIGTLVRAAIAHVMQYDGRLIATLRTLFRHPGQLARDHYDGKRRRYVPPFELFVLANVTGWLVVPFLHIFGFSVAAAQKLALLRAWVPSLWAWRESVSGIPHDLFVQRMDASAGSVNKMVVLLQVPIFAVFAKILLTRHRYVQHLVFSVHYYCIHLVTLLTAWGLVLIPGGLWIVAHKDVVAAHPWLMIVRNNSFQHLILAPILGSYLYVALKRAFVLNRIEAGWRAVVLALTACMMLRGFFDFASLLAALFA